MRPLTVPATPYTRQQILEHVYQHFVVERNPRAILDLSCVYRGMGCAIGCMITSDDAELWDSKAASIYYISRILSNSFNKYFHHEDMSLLKSLQDFHDSFEGDIPFSTAMKNWLKEEYGFAPS